MFSSSSRLTTRGRIVLGILITAAILTGMWSGHGWFIA
jgi:hypothetical protein